MYINQNGVRLVMKINNILIDRDQSTLRHLLFHLDVIIIISSERNLMKIWFNFVSHNDTYEFACANNHYNTTTAFNLLEFVFDISDHRVVF